MVQSEAPICESIPEEHLFSTLEKQYHHCDAPALTYVITAAVT